MKYKNIFFALFLSAGLLFFAGQGAFAITNVPDLKINEHIHIENAHTLVAPSWLKNRPIYMDILNTGQKDDMLVGASSPIAERVVLQYTHDYGQGVKTMRPLENQEILLPARAHVWLKPGGMHLMLTGLKRPLRLGLEIPLKLEFLHSNPRHIKVIIQKQPD